MVLPGFRPDRRVDGVKSLRIDLVWVNAGQLDFNVTGLNQGVPIHGFDGQVAEVEPAASEFQPVHAGLKIGDCRVSWPLVQVNSESVGSITPGQSLGARSGN
jgi:hypothetical protein